MSEGLASVGSFREAIQDLLVPEFEAVKVSIGSLRTEMKISDEALRTEMAINMSAIREENRLNLASVREEIKANREENRSNIASIREEMKLREQHLVTVIQAGDARNEQLILALSAKLDFAIDIRERLAVIEARQLHQ